MVEIAFLVVVALLAGVVFWLIAQVREGKKTSGELQQKLSETEATLSSRQSELEAKKFEAVELAAANRELRQQMERDRTDLGEKQKELKEQLELIGKTMVQQGTQLLRKENQENITLLLHP